MIREKSTFWGCKKDKKRHILRRAEGRPAEHKEDGVMAVFAVIQTQFDYHLEENIKKLNHLKIREGVWFVAKAGTANDMAKELDVLGGNAGSAVIVKVSSYHGWTSTNTWDWLEENWNRR